MKYVYLFCFLINFWLSLWFFSLDMGAEVVILSLLCGVLCLMVFLREYS